MTGYDYVIVGAGSAGCVLAERLSADPDRRVLLLEAGPTDDADEVRTPALMTSFFHGPRDWDYHTEPQRKADGRSVHWPQGRTLGGTSSTNAMIFVYGSPADYDAWRDDHGCAGWGYAELLPYLRDVAKAMRVGPARRRDRLTRAWVAAAVDGGLPPNDHLDHDDRDGVGFFHLNQRRGRRWSAADAFLRPAMARPNLTVRTGALVTGVVVEDGRATGVRYTGRDGEEVARASAEVILAAGAVRSPHLLLLSGIGPADQLRAHGIDVVADLPTVGSGLQDHPRVTAVWRMAERPRRTFGVRLRWRLTGTGPLASNGGEAGGFVRTAGGLPGPDLQFMVCPPAPLDGGAPSVAVLVTAVEVRSRGRVWLRRADPAAPPAIDPGYLTDDNDLAVLVAGVRRAREIAAHEPFAGLAAGELAPGLDVRDHELADWVRASVVTMHHPVGTCAMGGTADAVCDPSLRVRGVEGLRVVDASVMPVLPRGNTNAPTLALAARAADLILGRTPQPVRSTPS